ncbi:IclR family transcriptional regulator [Gordonia humi]|uniref:DNA-binding IclR family transcriptional regulator n=1 Tax=Gordonia humi TaxID=686429 RepID=A0A840F5V2_9ACTN|nr:IclR family transcriptional regulator [Gordonia humi]MBB4134917.1 DNA-binding IclR family transcriptional regulator [Gordonia humi]
MQALKRLLAILDIVAATGAASPAEIAAQMDLPFSTVARLTRQLAEEGLLVRGGESSRYEIGWRIFDLAAAGQGSFDLGAAAVPVMTGLRDRCAETVSLHVRSGDQRVCVAAVQSEAELRRVVDPGSVQGLVDTTGGEVLLAGEVDGEASAAVGRLDLSPDDVDALAVRLASIRARGYSVGVNEKLGITAISVPVEHAGRTAAVLSVSGPMFRFSSNAAEGLAADMIDVAAHIARLIPGGPGHAAP